MFSVWFTMKRFSNFEKCSKIITVSVSLVLDGSTEKKKSKNTGSRLFPVSLFTSSRFILKKCFYLLFCALLRRRSTWDVNIYIFVLRFSFGGRWEEVRGKKSKIVASFITVGVDDVEVHGEKGSRFSLINARTNRADEKSCEWRRVKFCERRRVCFRRHYCRDVAEIRREYNTWARRLGCSQIRSIN